MKEVIKAMNELSSLGFHIYPLDGDILEIRTPYTNHINDLIILYVVPSSTGSSIYCITDDGYTLNEFDLMGIDSDIYYKKLIVVKEMFDVIIDGIEMKVYTDKDNLIDEFNRILRAIISVDKLL